MSCSANKVKKSLVLADNKMTFSEINFFKKEENQKERIQEK